MTQDGLYDIYTVDDEEPKCGRCDNINEPYEFCEKYCGCEHGWFGYKRSARNDEKRY